MREELLKAIDDKQNRLRLFSSPFCMENQDNYLVYNSSSSTLPEENQLCGMFYNGSSLTQNEWLGNWNHSIRIGPGVICIQRNGQKEDLPTDYEQNWTGTISIYEMEQDTSSSAVKLDLCYKNTVGLIRKPSNGITYVYMGSNTNNSSSNTHHPIFARDSSRKELAGKRVVVMLDVYRQGELGETPAGGNVTFGVADDE